MAGFEWNRKRSDAALALSFGKTNREVAEEVKVNERSIYRWLNEPEFAAEVDRLTLMTGIAGKAERLRIAKRMIKDMIAKDKPTEKDLLDWIKYAQSETDGVKLNLFGELTAVLAANASMAGSGQAGSIPEEDTG